MIANAGNSIVCVKCHQEEDSCLVVRRENNISANWSLHLDPSGKEIITFLHKDTA